MARRTGKADLPLHGGRVPAWLANRMAALGRVITQAIVLDLGRDEWFRRMAHPFWFQCFGAVMGMDWHSSGITTNVLGALKRGLQPVASELGIHVCGGRGRHSRRTPDELLAIGQRVGLDGHDLGRSSRLVAKVDSAAVQDGFQIYLHSFIVADDGRWVVVQQGMNTDRRQARRYHWLSQGLRSFVDEPHSAIAGRAHGDILNLTDRRAEPARKRQVELARAGPDRLLEQVRRLPYLQMPAHDGVRAGDINLGRLRGNLIAAAERGPEDFTELLLTPRVGARTVQALALVAEVVYGAPARFEDPARFSYAHGGKDGHPFPVPLKVYDQTLRVMRHAVHRARLGQRTKLDAVKRLDSQSRRLEQLLNAPGAKVAETDWNALVLRERRDSHHYAGRTVFGHAQPGRRLEPPKAPAVPRQLELAV